MNASSGAPDLRIPPFLTAAVFTLLAAIYLVRLGAGSLWDNSEPTYGEIVKELFRTGDWLTLHLNFRPWDTHPPLWFWTAGLSAMLFGLNEFALRLPSALFGIATAIATYRAGRRMYGSAEGLIAALAAGTSLEMIVLSRLAMMETALIFFMTVAFFWSYFALRDGDGRALWIAAAAAALGTLTKGPIALVLPLLVILLWLAWTRGWSRLRGQPVLGAAVAYIVIAGSWFAIATMLRGSGFLGEYFGLSNVGRFLHPFENQPGPWWYYVPVLLLGFFPFIAFLPQALQRAWRLRSDDERFLLLCVAVPFVFFSIAQTKLPNYIAVFFPALGILVASFVGASARENNLRPLRSALIFLPAALVLLTAGIAFYGRLHFQGEMAALAPSLATLAWLVVVPCVLTAVLTVALKRVWLAPVGLSLTMAGFVAALAFFILPEVETFKPMKGMAAQLMSHDRAGDAVCFDGVSGGFSLLFYTESGPVTSIGHDPTDVNPKKYFAAEKRALCVVSPQRYDDLRASGLPLTVLARDQKLWLVTNSL
ncbi:MAG TPA: glycosyltransferase family 39 protein [Candidatus Eremiobacteraceae bacterium]